MVKLGIMAAEAQALRAVLWGLLVLGLLTIGLGVFLIAEPHETLKVLTVILGIFLLTDGVLAIFAALVGRGEGRASLVLLGVVGVIAGVVLIEKPFAALQVFLIIVAIWFLVAGISRIVYAFTIEEGRAGYVVLGLLDAAVAILILAWPSPSLSTIAVILGVVLIVRGILDTFIAWSLLRIGRAEGALGSPLST